MKKRIAIIGSSGGNLYSQGGNEPQKLLQEIINQANSAEIEISYIQFIGASASMDNISQDSKVSLYTYKNGSIEKEMSGTLSEVNEYTGSLDKSLADKIQNGEIDGIVTMSADPSKLNKASAEAAKEKQIPIAGSGGTAMGTYQKMGCNVISATGTTGTTNRTRAIAYISALSEEFGIKYRPIIGSSQGQVEESSPWKRINFRGIMMAAMPAFIAMALLLALSRIPGLDDWILRVSGKEEAMLANISSQIIGLLPIILAAIAAKQISGFDEVGIVAGIIAGSLSSGGGVLGGIITGILAGVLVYYISIFMYKKKVPGTTVNIIAGAFAGIIAGFVGMYLISPVALFVGNGIREIIDIALGYNAMLAGVLAGLLIWPAIIGGVYHAAILPIVLLEMETNGFSFLGAIDMTGLVMVSAGITLANIVFPRTHGDRAAAIPGFAINIGFGTFVEAAYPYMFGDRKVFTSAIIASTVSGALVGLLGVKGTAYVPTFSAPFLSNEGHAFQMLLCMLVAMAIAFIGTSIANKFAISSQDINNIQE